MEKYPRTGASFFAVSEQHGYSVSLGRGDSPPTPTNSLKHQHHHPFSKGSLISGWRFPGINMVTIGFEVLKMVCSLIKAVYGEVGGRGGARSSSRDSASVEQAALFSPAPGCLCM